MANSKYEYVRNFERDEILLPNTWIVVRIDGRGFHKLSNHYHFTKPNDARALSLMNAAASSVLSSIPDLTFAFGVSDEYSFVFNRSTSLFERRAAKLISTVVSAFTAHYIYAWDKFFEGGEGFRLEEKCLPTFDGRVVCFPSVGNLRDYLAWRQVDCHINNLYNTTFWAMVQLGKMTPTAAEEELKGTLAADKNEILFKRFGINYNNENEMFRKGSAVFRAYALEDTTGAGSEGTAAAGDRDGVEDERNQSTEVPMVPSKTQVDKHRRARAKARVVVEHVDIIKDDFWQQRPWILSGKLGRPVVSAEEGQDS